MADWQPKLKGNRPSPKLRPSNFGDPVVSRMWILRKIAGITLNNKSQLTSQLNRRVSPLDKGVCFPLACCFQASKWPQTGWKRKPREWGAKK